MNINLMIVDDHMLIREGIRKLIELDNNLSVVEEASNGYECIDKLFINKEIDIILLDINMPIMNGIEVVKHIKNEKMDIKILVLTIHDEIDWLLQVYDLGVDGYILKDSKFEDLRTAIYEVYNGNTYIQPSMIKQLNSSLIKRDNDSDKLKLLTEREIEILKLVTSGLINKEIASELHISERTVKNHISSIFKKIDVSDRTQAAVFAIKNNVVQI